MSRTREEITESRRRIRAEYGALFDSVAALLYRHDPIGINCDGEAPAPTDEFEPEAETILPRLRNCHALADVQEVVHGEFVRWFDRGTAGPAEGHREIASEIWQLWKGHLENRPDTK